VSVVQSSNGLVSVSRSPLGLVEASIAFYENTRQDYEDIYRTQPELRSAVDFLARNVSQLPLHAFVRISDLERQRVTGVPLTDTLERPDKTVTRSRWLDALVKDLAIFDSAYFVKVRGEDGRLALVRIPPGSIELLGENWLIPDGYRVRGTHGTVDFTRDQVIDIHGYNPSDPRRGLSPIETLRRLLAEQDAAGRYREKFWENSARMGGVIERPAAAPNWSPEARSRFRADFEASYTGAAASGRTLVLEEGMTYRPVSYSARDSQYLEAFQLSREVVATAYGIPVGLLGLGATNYASLTEQHRQLYADCLAPWLTRIQEELEAQLLPEFADLPDGVYLEFNLAAKLAGSFTEQAAVLQASVGAPYLTRNEARARLNLSPIEGGDELVTPLNVLIGGQASPQDSVSDDRVVGGALSEEPQAKSIEAAAAVPDQAKALRRQRILRERRAAADEFAASLVDALERQRRSVIAKLGAKSKTGVKATVEEVYNVERFTTELARDLRPPVRKLARRMANTVGEWDPDNAADYLDAFADGTAEAFNASTAERLARALEEGDIEDIDGLFDEISAGTALTMAASVATAIGEFARSEAAAAADIAEKTWVVTSGNPRSAHATLDGETVPRSETFSNGAAFPGDPVLDASEKANCQCLVDWGV
jgi:HK97 family phage portal protein